MERGNWSREGRLVHSSIITYIMGYTIQVVNYRQGAKSGRDGLDASRSVRTTRDVCVSGHPDLRLLILSPIQNQMVQRM